MPDPIDWGTALPYYLAAFVAGYLFGSIPFGLILTRLAGLGDIRKIGSGNIGATNVLRTGNKALAAATLVLDAIKGGVPVAVAFAWFGPDIAVLTAFGAFIGHLFPVWLGFKGGKGVAVFLGINLGLFWLVGLMTCATWLGAAVLLRVSSLSALFAAAATPLYYWVFAKFQYAELASVLAILIWIAHRENIKRLIEGVEPQIGKK